MACEQLDAALGQEPVDPLRRLEAEDLERCVLGRHDDQIGRDVALRQVVGGQERKLVEGEQPTRPCRGGEGEPVREAMLEIIQRPREILPEAGGRDRDRAWHPNAQLRTDRDQERVVGADRAGLRNHAVVRPHALESIRHERRALIRRDPVQVEALNALVAEERGELHRPMDELGVRRQQVDLDTVLGQLAQGEQRLERRHPTTRDHDLVRGRRAAIGLCSGGWISCMSTESSVQRPAPSARPANSARSSPQGFRLAAVTSETHTGRLDGDRLARLIEVGRSLVAELNLSNVLDRVLEVARELTGARYAALGILDEEKRELEQFLTVGIDEAQRNQIGALPRGHGVLGLLIRDPKPLRLDGRGLPRRLLRLPARPSADDDLPGRPG